MEAQYGMCPLCGELPKKFRFCDKAGGYFFTVLDCQKCDVLISNPRLRVRAFNQVTEIDTDLANICSRNLSKYDYLFNFLTQASLQGCRILDIGCCRGEFVQIALKRGYDAYGVDMVPVFIDFASKNIDPNRFAVVQADIKTALQFFPTQRFQVATLWDVIEHIDEPVAFCKEIAQLLDPPGFLFLRTPNRAGQLLKEKLLRPIFGDEIPYLQAIEHVNVFGTSGMGLLAEKAGFNMLTCLPSSVEAYGDRGRWFDFLKKYLYAPLVHGTCRLTGLNLAHSMNCILVKGESA